MENSTSDNLLSDSEFRRLVEFLDSIGNPAMNIETLDGFFAALICSPHVVSPWEYLPTMFGQEALFDTNEQAAGLNELLTRHWNTVSFSLQRAQHEPGAYLPVLLDRGDGVAPANDWAHGFMRAVQMRPDGWDELIDDEDHSAPMEAIMILHHEHDPDPERRPPPLSPEKRKIVVRAVIAGLPCIYRYFQPHQRPPSSSAAPLSAYRAQHGTSTTELCPCGSDREYKYCCLGKPVTLH